GFNDRSTRLQFPFLLRRFDHRERDPVLDRATGILILKFEKQLARPSVELRNLHQGRVADQRKNVRRFIVRCDWRRKSFRHEKPTRWMVRLYATIPTGCLREIVGAQENGLRRNLMRSGDRRLCKSKSSGSTRAAGRRIV